MYKVTYTEELNTELGDEYQPIPEKLIQAAVPPHYQRFMKVFSEESSKRLPKHRHWDHKIDLKEGSKPFRSKVYPMPSNEQQALDDWIKEQLEKGYIVESKSPMSSPFFFIKKKDGNLRPIQDYRKLNDITIKNSYPLPLISELLDRLKGAKIFTKLDLRWGYNNIRIAKEEEWKAAFVTSKGLFQPRVMFFGLTNSPATFQGVMNEIFADLVAKGVMEVYMDDILIYSADAETHRKTTTEVLRRLEENDFYLKPEKCEFDRDRLEYLGCIISHNKIEMDPKKITAITEWKVPSNVKEVRAFKGYANYYRRFINGFSHICKPLDRLTGKVDWFWGKEEQE